MPVLPDYAYESAAANPVAGVDEVGRGPWAGSVVAAAVILDANNIPENIQDSKKLSKPKRELLFDKIKSVAHVGIGEASVEEIDRMNILRATKLAMQRAVLALPVVPAFVLVDGNQCPQFLCPARAIVKGDSKSLSIAAASIIAKVTRDRMMEAMAREFPYYGFETNAGYGTAAHQAALARYGITPHHRKSFAPIRALLESAA